MFVVQVADNFHYMDPDETHTEGEFATWDLAVAAARRIVDCSLADYCRPGVGWLEMYEQYTRFGEDPYIIPTPDGQRFSAWDYAKQRCQELCPGQGVPSAEQSESGK